jgi:hypothetical protein
MADRNVLFHRYTFSLEAAMIHHYNVSFLRIIFNTHPPQSHRELQ